MSKAEEKAMEHCCATCVHDKFGCSMKVLHNGRDCIKCGNYIKGYDQAGKDIIENKHEKSWRLDEQLWKGIKDIEEASYQYMYDASNDWAYDVPTWEDVQDAFKAGAGWKENSELTWKDISTIREILCGIVGYPLTTDKEVCTEVLKRFKELKNVK